MLSDVEKSNNLISMRLTPVQRSAEVLKVYLNALPIASYYNYILGILTISFQNERCIACYPFFVICCDFFHVLIIIYLLLGKSFLIIVRSKKNTPKTS